MNRLTRILAFVALCAEGCRAPQFLAADMPRLVVWTAEVGPDGRCSSAECSLFWKDFRDESTGLSKALRKNFDVFRRDVEENRLAAVCRDVRRVPTFVTGNRWVEGYTTPQDLCVRLGLAVVETGRGMPPPPPRRDAETESDETTKDQSLDKRGLIEAIERQARIVAEIQKQQTEGKASAAQLDQQGRRIESLSGLIDALNQRLADAPSAKPSPAVEPEKTPPTGLIEGIAGLLPVVLPLLGVAGPAGAAAGVGVWLLGRWIRRRRELSAPIAGTIAPSPRAPPPNEPIIARIPDTAHREAFAWSAEQFLRRYPTQEALVETLKALIAQYLKENPRA